ncbi:MAG: transposase [Spirochaetales bacterium]|nr:transposase [Spirochaetales bacterium]
MPRVRYSTEQIINKLRQAEVLISQGRSVNEAAKELAISDHTYCRWRGTDLITTLKSSAPSEQKSSAISATSCRISHTLRSIPMACS